MYGTPFTVNVNNKRVLCQTPPPAAFATAEAEGCDKWLLEGFLPTISVPKEGGLAWQVCLSKLCLGFPALQA